MELKEFVRDTLVQVAQGVEAAQGALSDSSVLINPPAGADVAAAQALTQAGQRNPTHLVELDLAVAPGDGGVVVADPGRDHGRTSRLRFSIGVSFPVQERRPSEPDFELAVEPSGSG
jgi:hypothetical protein